MNQHNYDVALINRLDDAQFAAKFARLSGSRAWCAELLRRRPFASATALLEGYAALRELDARTLEPRRSAPGVLGKRLGWRTPTTLWITGFGDLATPGPAKPPRETIAPTSVFLSRGLPTRSARRRSRRRSRASDPTSR